MPTLYDLINLGCSTRSWVAVILLAYVVHFCIVYSVTKYQLCANHDFVVQFSISSLVSVPCLITSFPVHGRYSLFSIYIVPILFLTNITVHEGVFYCDILRVLVYWYISYSVM